MIWYLGVTFLGSLAALGWFVYSFCQGQFDDVEEPKYRMLRED
jgi:nitrogen fixation-related uncharacterized protein